MTNDKRQMTNLIKIVFLSAGLFLRFFVVGCWLLVVGCWLLVVGKYYDRDKGQMTKDKRQRTNDK